MAQAARRAGTVTFAYPGATSVGLRAGRRAAALRITQAGRTVAGRISRRARGSVLVRVDGGRAVRAPIRDGRWTARIAATGRVTATYAGHAGRRIWGEQAVR